MQKLQFLIYFNEKTIIAIYFIFQFNYQIKIFLLFYQIKCFFDIQIIYIKENKIVR